MTTSADLAAALGCHPCSLSRWLTLGMPAEVRVKVSNGYLYDECKVRAWLALPGCPAHVTAARVAK